MKNNRYEVKREYYTETPPILTTSTNELNIEISAFSIYTGAIRIKNIGKGDLEGRIFSKMSYAQFTPNEWQDNEPVILYRIDTKAMMWGRRYEDVWLIESNGGEQEISVHIDVKKPLLIINEHHSISSLEEFSVYAKDNWNSAKNVFFSPLFSNWLIQNKELRLHRIYSQLSMTTHKDWALEHFIRLTGYKQKPSLWIQEQVRKIVLFPPYDMPIEKGIIVRKKGWGLIDIDLKSNVKWIRLSKTHYTYEDFRQDKLIINYEILGDRINNKKEIGYIYIIYEDVRISYEVRVTAKEIFSITLSKKSYAQEDNGFLIIENNTGEDAMIEISPQEQWIQFETRKYLISKRAEIPFIVRLTSWDKFGLGKKPYYQTIINVKSNPKRYKFNDNFTIKVDTINLQPFIEQWYEEIDEVNDSYNAKYSKAMSCLINSYIYKQKSEYLIKALNLFYNIYQENPIDLKVVLFIIQLNLQLERYEEGYSLLKALLKFKKYFKVNDKTLLGIIYYFKAILDYYRGKHMFIQKSIKALDECLESQNSGVLYFLKAKLEKELFDENKNELKYYFEAFNHGFRSPFLFFEVYRIITSNIYNFYNMKDMLRIVFIWAIRYKLFNIENIKLFTNWMLQYQNTLIMPISYIEDIHNKWDTSETLSLLCSICMKENKKDEVSLKIYEKAIERRIYVKGIHLAYLETSYKLGKRDIPPSILQSALLKEEFDEELTAYIYSILCTGSQNKMLYQINYSKILLFGEKSLRSNKKGKYYIDIYIKLLEKTPNNYLLKRIIFEHLFLYEIFIKSPLVKYIWIMENEKENMTTFTVDGDKLYIEAASDKVEDLVILCVGQKQRSFYSIDYISITKLIKEIPIQILLEHYEEGYKNTNLLISLTKYFINQIQQNIELSSISNKAEEIMLECLENSLLSNDFREKTSGALGSLFSRNNDFKKAASYYKLLNPNDLSSIQVQEGINAFIENSEIELAIQWAQKCEEINTQIKYSLTKKSIDLGIINPLIINISYELFQKGQYDEKIERYLINYYEGILGNWYKIRDAMTSLGKPTHNLDIIILDKGVWVKSLSEDLEKIFHDLYEKEKISPSIQNFISYCSYEILINKKLITLKTLHKFEEIFANTKDMILGLAMLHIYPRYLDSIEDKKNIILPIFEWMKANQFILPIVKDKQDKFPYFSYIEQNVPFIHHTRWGRKVTFCYKIQGFPLIRKKMYPVAYNLYAICISIFYSEDMEYYIEEMDEEGNCILSEVRSYHYDTIRINTDTNELYERLNNAIIYSKDQEFEKAEKILETIIYESQRNNIGYLL